MNINDIISQPTMFKDFKSFFALCYKDGTIYQVFTNYDSAKYLLNNYNLGHEIYEVVQNNKGKIIANLGVK